MTSANPNKTTSNFVVKVCGVTHPDDAAAAVAAGADLVGTVLWPKAGRSCSVEEARAVADATRAGGGIPVGLFVDESAETIAKVAAEARIDHVQARWGRCRGGRGRPGRG